MDPETYDQVFEDLRGAAGKYGIDLGEVTINEPKIRSRMVKEQAIAAVNVAAGNATGDPRGGSSDENGLRESDWLGRLGEWANVQGRTMHDRVSGGGGDILQRVVAHGVSADGTAPVTVEGSLVAFVDANRYLVNAATRLPLPDNAAPTFKRPRLTQRTTVGQQVSEGDVLSSQRLQLTGDTVQKNTYGGVLALSEQEIAWTDPSMLALAIKDLAMSYAIQTESVLCQAVEAAVTSNKVVLSNTAAADVFIAAVSAASAVVYSAAKKLPDLLYCAPDRWAYMTSITDNTGRPLFPITGGANSGVNAPGANADGVTTFGGFNIMGLQVVVSPEFDSGTWGVGYSGFIEFYEQDRGILNIAVPSTLETQYAYRGFAATLVQPQAVCGFETS